MRTSPAWLWILVAIQVAIPASYYLGWRGEDDERFAWRMFSAVRLKRCSVEAFDADPDAQPDALSSSRVDLARAVHASWSRSLARGRPYVVERFLQTRCAHRGVQVAALVRRCQWPSGRRMPEDHYRLDCAALHFDHRTRNTGEGPAPSSAVEESP